jgi:hypothetical protein
VYIDAILLNLEQATGIEPAAQPWEGWVLPLYDACALSILRDYSVMDKV